VKQEIIWDIVQDDLSVLRGQLADLLFRGKNSAG